MKAVLDRIDPVCCTYEEWIHVGMALKHEGYSPGLWDEWSKRDPARYHTGECQKKWYSFHNDCTNVITGATLYHMAHLNKWTADNEKEITWGSAITVESPAPTEGLPDASMPQQASDTAAATSGGWHPASMLISYLEILFQPDEIVSYCMQSYKNRKSGKYVPKNRGSYDRTAGELISELRNCSDDIGAVFGDYDPEGGAWIRFNPVDGKGIRNENVTAFRHALVESDDMPVGDQLHFLHEMHLPIAVLVHSGGKSLHAVVRVDAHNYEEYRERVSFLYDTCEKHGMHIDRQNKNPSRMSRMPGVIRGSAKQYIIESNIGAAGWDEWCTFIKGQEEEINDSLPDFENLSSVWNTMPDLAPELISGILRCGHKMLLAGPSKAGKSFLLIELAICIAEGLDWLGHSCRQGNVIYVNLELDKASCLHRFQNVYTALGIGTENLDRINIWNLRGQAVPLDSLVPKLVRRAKGLQPAAIIIDPVYKVITGDENSAEQMSKFCAQLDILCTELGCSVIYCHHHSKGAQGGKKSMDRASGSGVFARDADALLDLIELPVKKELRNLVTEQEICREIICGGWLEKAEQDKEDSNYSVNQSSAAELIRHCENAFNPNDILRFRQAVEDARVRGLSKSAWQVDATLREFPESEPVNLWYCYPVHSIDEESLLKDISPGQNQDKYSRIQDRNRKTREESINRFVAAYSFLAERGKPVSVSELADALQLSPNTIIAWFGTGNKRKEELARRFEKQIGPDGKTYIVQKKAIAKET